MWVHGYPTLLGLDKRFVLPRTPLAFPGVLISSTDADNFYNSSIFDPDPDSGFGGWGDPQDDFQITTGAFASDFERPYPVPHRLRRNYTLFSTATGFGPPITDPLNTFFTPERIEVMVDGFPGDFVSFQALFEGGHGSHGAVHQIVGGCVVMVGFVLSFGGTDFHRQGFVWYVSFERWTQL